MGEKIFINFCGAIKLIRSQQLPRLPAKDSSLGTFFDFLNGMKGVELACQLLHALGSWRFLEQYHELKDQKREERNRLPKQVDRARTAGKSASQARYILLHIVGSRPEKDAPSAQEIQKLESQLDYRIEASKVWYDLCEIAGPAIIAMIPPIPRTR